MYLDLHEVIECPGAGKRFSCELDAQRLSFPALVRFDDAVTASGEVKNSAGVLHVTAEVSAQMTVLCDRCTAAFRTQKLLPVDVVLAEGAEDSEDPTVYPLEGDGVDIASLLETCFILEQETRFLCSSECRGLCPDCGKNLNDGPCGCRKPMDPRMAVLGQLLDK